MEEVWKDVIGWEGYYQVSTSGKVRALARTILSSNGHKGLTTHERKVRELRPSRNPDGYKIATFSRDGIMYYKSVSRLVAEAFIPNPENKPQVNHINGIKTDNRVDNLEWNTQEENQQHAYRTGLNVPLRGVKAHNSKLDQCQINTIRSIWADSDRPPGMGMMLARYFKVSTAAISLIVNHIRYR